MVEKLLPDDRHYCAQPPWNFTNDYSEIYLDFLELNNYNIIPDLEILCCM